MACWAFLLPSSALASTLLDALGRVAYLVAFVLLALFAIVFSFVKSRELYGSGDSARQDQRINCPSCGARTPAESKTCEYCDEPIRR